MPYYNASVGILEKIGNDFIDRRHIFYHFVVDTGKSRYFLGNFLFGVYKGLEFIHDFSVYDFNRADFRYFIAAEIGKPRRFDIDDDESFSDKTFGNAFNRVEKSRLRHIFERFGCDDRIKFGYGFTRPFFGFEILGKFAEGNVDDFKARKSVERA